MERRAPRAPQLPSGSRLKNAEKGGSLAPAPHDGSHTLGGTISAFLSRLSRSQAPLRVIGVELMICLFGDRGLTKLREESPPAIAKVCERTASLLDPESSLIGPKNSLFGFLNSLLRCVGNLLKKAL